MPAGQPVFDTSTKHLNNNVNRKIIMISTILIIIIDRERKIRLSTNYKSQTQIKKCKYVFKVGLTQKSTEKGGFLK